MKATARSVELRSIAREVVDALPTTVEEVVVTGSVSRGVADDISDIEMLVVTDGELELEDCFGLAAACGLTDLGTWGPQGGRRGVSRATATGFRSSSCGGRAGMLSRRSTPWWLGDAREILVRRLGSR